MINSLTIKIAEYSTFLFDCDGVVLDSNSIKSDAFGEIAQQFGSEIRDQFVAYHKDNGGISRFDKIRYLVERLLGQSNSPHLVNFLISSFGEICKKELAASTECSGVRHLLEMLHENQKVIHVVSGGLETELIDVFSLKGFTRFFSTINGSPRDKKRILSDLKSANALVGKCLFFGDSRADHESAKYIGADFIFVSDYTEFRDWVQYTEVHQVPVIRSFDGLRVVQ